MSRLALALILCAATAVPALAQPGAKPPGAKPPAGWKPPVIDMGGLRLDGRLRTPQLLYFLERADEELERASLEKRSFIPEMVRTIDEDAL